MNLTLENCTEFVRSNGPEAVREAVRETYAAETEAKEALRAKCAAYFDGKKQRFQRIVEQIEKVQEQRRAVEAEKGQHDRCMVEATILGDGETVEAVQKELERCASAIAAYDAQVVMFKGYELRGDPALFAELEEDRAALRDLIEGNKAIRKAMFQITEEIKNAWASAVYKHKSELEVITRPSDYREPWEIQADRVRDDQRKTPETVGAKLDAAARQQGAAAPRAVFPGH